MPLLALICKCNLVMTCGGLAEVKGDKLLVVIREGLLAVTYNGLLAITGRVCYQ